MKLHSTEELIADISEGKMIIIMDDEDRENEGDFIIAAEHCTAETINFMSKHGRGLICLTLTGDRCKKLNLGLMVRDTQATHSTNFTLSIEAATGVTTGISASDRARTVEAAVSKDATADDITQPGQALNGTGMYEVRRPDGTRCLVRVGAISPSWQVASGNCALRNLLKVVTLHRI